VDGGVAATVIVCGAGDCGASIGAVDFFGGTHLEYKDDILLECEFNNRVSKILIENN